MAEPKMEKPFARLIQQWKETGAQKSQYKILFDPWRYKKVESVLPHERNPLPIYHNTTILI